MNQRSAVILLGPPGSGKTTITKKLTSGGGVQTLETGSLLREEVVQVTELGEKLKPFLDEGKLAPTEMVAQVVAQGMQQLNASVILFDGFPRREEEISAFFDQIKVGGFDLSAVLVLELSRSLAVDRILNRGERQDDNPDTVNERLNIYERETGPVIEYFETNYANRTYKESVDKPIEEIVDSIVSNLQQVGLDIALKP